MTAKVVIRISLYLSAEPAVASVSASSSSSASAGAVLAMATSLTGDALTPSVLSAPEEGSASGAGVPAGNMCT